MPSDDEIADFLEDSADYMEQHGSCRGVLQDEAGQVCMLGAMEMILHERAELFRNEFYNEGRIDKLVILNRAAVDAIYKVIDNQNIPHFSDASSHQKRLDTLRMAAKKSRR